MTAFAHKVAIVTGAASGIGRALGEALARSGAHVVLADVRVAAMAEVAAAIARDGGSAEARHLDVTDAGAVRSLVEETRLQRGRLDFMFNNAGISIIAEARDMELSDWTRVLDVNLRGVVHGVHAAFAVMTEQGFGHIVNTASLAGLLAVPCQSAYTASKHAIVGLSLALRAEAWASGVRVSVACPGFVATSIAEHSRCIGFDREQLKKRAPR